MQKFHVSWLERKVGKSGKPYTVLTLDKEDGSKVDATIFSSFLNYANIKAGDTVEGELKGKEFMGKVSYTLEVPFRSTTSNFARSGGSIGGGSSMMKEKQEGIKESQDRKEHSIKESSSMRDAVQLAIAEFQAFNGEDELRPTLDYLISKWRKFLLDNWSLPF